MEKIPTLFLRDPADRAHVLNEVNPDAQWVLDGEGVATRKYDGTCVMFDGSEWWARREVKPGKATPANYRPVSIDPVTGKTMGWEPIEQSAFAKFHTEALSGVNKLFALAGSTRFWEPGTYELIGPKINGNPESATSHTLVAHANARHLDAPRDFDGLRTFLTAPDFRYEGIVWHHLDGRMAKLKRRDFR